jgi:uncharacterized surface protein with fasciclin (FAS1) repeats
MRRIALSMLTAIAVVSLAAVPASAHGGGKSGKHPWKPAPPAPTANLVETAVAASGGGAFDDNEWDYDILVQAVLATGLAPTLSDAGAEFTVFAPNDKAFRKTVWELTNSWLPEKATFDTLVATLGVDTIRQVLLYHVVGGARLSPSDVVSSSSLTMANGGTVGVKFPKLVDQDPDLRNPRLVLKAIDIQATNGVIHTIDRVLLPVDL